MFAQLDIGELGSNPKTWIVLIGGTLVSLIVGRFIQAFKNGEGIVGAAKAVWLGTNTPKPKQNETNTNNPDRIV